MFFSSVILKVGVALNCCAWVSPSLLPRMAGKDGKAESKGGDVTIKQGFMVKRSQNKKRFTPVNYKQRWFVLTRRHLIYYDGDGEGSLNALKVWY
ncbi:ras GTPase-activating protein 3-like [Belonocnema kinseyi]|uniref:ras GTPase-activating protein 3-like n=1 Tax=Belonocnema kinseyi TaxID=2817044 RepID=UPI00143DFE88|nr:ras GTPase-activating protein 3-like [Belonocnema kinseyi]